MFGTIPKKGLSELDKYWQAFPALRDALFRETSRDYVALKSEDVKNTITKHSDVKKCINAYLVSFVLLPSQSLLMFLLIDFLSLLMYNLVCGVCLLFNKIISLFLKFSIHHSFCSKHNF
jgi:hypothetical protein